MPTQLLSPKLVKKQLAGHSWTGLMTGALMYLICLTGALCVFYPEFQRWEQADIRESLEYDPATLEESLNAIVAGGGAELGPAYLYLPHQAYPRLYFRANEESRFIETDGSAGEPVAAHWTDLLIQMHVYLTLPRTWGIILVSALGAMLCGLIISGFLSHPGLIREAFKLRLGTGSRLEQVDLHNRLSVWGAPFHLLIAITGAYFGLALPMLAALGAISGMSQEELLEEVFGETPALEQPVSRLGLAAAFNNLQQVDPEAEPRRVIVHNAGTPAQYIEISAAQPGRMIGGENYHFGPDGGYLGSAGLRDGEAGRQVVFSMFNLHTGHFGGYIVKLAYAVLGFALTVVSVTGVNIWLRKRKKRDAINGLWAGCVWGIPLALMIPMIGQIAFQTMSTELFWLSLTALLIFSGSVRDERRVKRHLQIASIATVALLLGAHLLRFGAAAFGPAAILINGSLMLYLAYLVWSVAKPLRLPDSVAANRLSRRRNRANIGGVDQWPRGGRP